MPSIAVRLGTESPAMSGHYKEALDCEWLGTGLQALSDHYKEALSCVWLGTELDTKAGRCGWNR